MCHFISFDMTFGTHPESFSLPSSKKPLAISTFQRQVQRIVRMFDDTRRWEDRPLSCSPNAPTVSVGSCVSLSHCFLQIYVGRKRSSQLVTFTPTSTTAVSSAPAVHTYKAKQSIHKSVKLGLYRRAHTDSHELQQLREK